MEEAELIFLTMAFEIKTRTKSVICTNSKKHIYSNTRSWGNFQWYYIYKPSINYVTSLGAKAVAINSTIGNARRVGAQSK